MSTVGKTLAGVAAASLLLAAAPAFAISESEDDLAQLREQMKGLQERVEAQEEQMRHQAELLQDAQHVVRQQQRDEESLSAVAEFWQAIDVNMSVAGSYAWNFKQPGSGAAPGFGANQGSNGAFYPFHPDHNSFQVDQVWFDIGKEATDESRAGFQFTLLYGNTASALGQGSPVFARGGLDSTSDYYIHQAYVSYLAPIGEGVEFDFGKFATLIGAEVADTTQNFNITNGNVYNLLQPIDHLGLLASTSMGPISVAAGIVNQGSLTFSSPDVNKEKTYLGSVGFGDDMFNAGLTVLYGAEGGGLGLVAFGDNQQRVGLLDFLATLETDMFEAWLNADYFWVEGGAASAWGFAAAGRVHLTEQVSAALRAEYARDRDGNTSGGFAPIFGLNGSAGPSFNHAEIYGLTGTLAYEIVEHLTLRGELRWDRVVQRLDPGEVEEFLTRTSGGNKNQVVALGQVVYDF